MLWGGEVGGCIIDRWLHEVAGLWGAGDYTFVWDFCILAV